MIIPFSQLSTDILDGVLQDLASREGTDYAEMEIPLAQKLAQLKLALERRHCYLVFDEISESLGLVTHQEAQQQGLL